MNVNVFGSSLLPASARKPALFKKAAALVMKREGVRAKGELNVIVVDRKKMLAINKKYLDHGHDTDVIAFNYDPFPGAPADEPFGDVYVSAFQARKQAGELGHPILTEVLTLIIHGALHLAGYDDHTPRQRAAMFRKQEALLGELLPAARRARKA